MKLINKRNIFIEILIDAGILILAALGFNYLFDKDTTDKSEEEKE